MRLTARLSLLATLVTGGCYPFITGGLYESRLCELDEDGDGNLKCPHPGPDGIMIPGDCNDNDPRMSYLNPEIPYDGIDNDCSGFDLIDQDDDGWAGISRQDYEALGGLPWPAGMPDEEDCDDLDPDINPGATEIYYDGIDQNCDGLCDFDADQDGFADRRQGQDNDCGIPATDCLDTDPDIYPGAPGEVYYDGEDTNCDGTNDFDPDGDGFAWNGYQAENERFLERYGYEDTIVAYTECYDIDDSPLPETNPIDPASVSPSQPEVWYNGVDDDCSDVAGPIQSDFDRDGDGFMPTVHRAAFLNYVQRYVDYTRHDGTRPLRDAFVAAFGPDRAAWEAYFDSHDNDCDDNDPTVFPGALERLGDSVDQDCDGHPDTTPLVFSRATFRDLGQPRVVATDDAFVLLAAVTDRYDDGATAPGAQVAAVSFPRNATGATAPTFDNTPYPTGSNPLTPSLGAVGAGDRYYTGLWWNTTSSSGTTRSRLAVMNPTSAGSARFQLQSTVDGLTIATRTPHDRGGMVLDQATGRLWSIACDGARFQFTEVNTSGLVRGASNFENTDAEGCFVLPSAANGTLSLHTVRPTGAIRNFTVGGGGIPVEFSSGPFSGYSASHASNHGEWVVFGMRPSGVRLYRNASTVRNVLSGITTSDAAAHVDGSTAYVLAVQPSGGGSQVWMTYGNPTGTMTTTTLPVRRDGAAIDPERVAVIGAGNRLMIAVAGIGADGTEQLGWAFFEI